MNIIDKLDIEGTLKAFKEAAERGEGDFEMSVATNGNDKVVSYRFQDKDDRVVIGEFIRVEPTKGQVESSEMVDDFVNDLPDVDDDCQVLKESYLRGVRAGQWVRFSFQQLDESEYDLSNFRVGKKYLVHFSSKDSDVLDFGSRCLVDEKGRERFAIFSDFSTKCYVMES